MSRLLHHPSMFSQAPRILRPRPVRVARSSFRQQSSLPEKAVSDASKIAADLRFPRSVEILHLKPLRREAEYGVPTCDLQLRSYSVRPLEFFADFALRAAYYLGLPAFGPVPLPRITERWTVPRSNFIFKKSQENFERVTVRRLIQIRDGNPESVQTWLAFLQKHAYYGIGMKANVWEFGRLVEGKSMDEIPADASKALEDTFAFMGQHKPLGTAETVEELLSTRRFKPVERRSKPQPQPK